jgi:hypothetical protein
LSDSFYESVVGVGKGEWTEMRILSREALQQILQEGVSKEELE